MSKEKLKDLLTNKDFVQSISNVKSIEDLQKVLADNGVELSVEEAKELLNSFNDVGKVALSDNVLDKVAGGGYKFFPPKKEQ